jgi:hypothetical protein
VSGFARLRLDATRACVERLAGVLDAPLDDGSTRAGPAETAAPETAASLDVAVAVGSGGERRVWRCGVR